MHIYYAHVEKHVQSNHKCKCIACIFYYIMATMITMVTQIVSANSYLISYTDVKHSLLNICPV